MAKNMFDLDDSLLQTKKDYTEDLKKARALCIRGQYDRALEIYNKILDEDYENEEALIGILRVHSKDFREYVSIDIENDIHAIESLCPDTINEDYLNYLSKRKDNISTKTENKDKKNINEDIKIKDKIKDLDSDNNESEDDTVTLNCLTKDIVLKIINENKNLTTFEITNKYSCVEVDALEPLEKTKVNKIIFSNIPINNGDNDNYCYNFEDYGAPNNIKTIEIKGSVKKIPKHFFSNIGKHDGNMEFILNDGILEIQEFAFCNSCIKDIIIPSSVLIIGEAAFYGCVKLEKINMENCRIKEVPNDLLLCCSLLKEVRLPSISNIREGGLYFPEEGITQKKQCKIYIKINSKNFHDILLNCSNMALPDLKYCSIKLIDECID